MSQPRDDRQDDLFGPSLDKIINLRHPLVRLAADAFLAGRFSSVCRIGPGQPPLPTRLVAGLLILKRRPYQCRSRRRRLQLQPAPTLVQTPIVRPVPDPFRARIHLDTILNGWLYRECYCSGRTRKCACDADLTTATDAPAGQLTEKVHIG